MAGFVIEYNRLSGERRIHSFPGTQGHRDALRRRLELEATRESGDWEIVSLNSDSIETVRRTHARYFERDRLSA